ncbi:potassium-transporting ATPase subunit KdpA (plasmid) [Lichenicola cladoniae]|uniref:Potassium-transporting ATPase potassium-binding subunit n=1 Tax=Lichenicola cladoniae TaxID=1484109 RepID=A0A6M8HZ54_9PROT|nr:potassium-transporting ATPase subunit KdpA [Lichenicola cladoniae]NPD70069.1 potassium-transporting ATPase subunit KdpA [Acetobacteraceae bacterium]QKE93854.1 potassium-transporting ATPase subunit KdpA [Lichenicola cladoniae]
MTSCGILEIVLILAATCIFAVPVGNYLAAVMEGRSTLLAPVLAPVERGFYRLSGIDPFHGMSWRSYATALLLLNALHFAMLYAILRLQFYLPFNPQAVVGMPPSIAFNTAISFVTNTNWQAYVPESGISNGAQMFGLTVHNFLSAATGIAVAVAVMRALAAGGLKTLGNFWSDLTRATLYVLLPLTCVFTILLMASGVPDTLHAFAQVTTLEGIKQTIALGPVAFQEAIKELGTNGGGFFNTNSSHPFENPTALTCGLETFMLLLIPFALPIAFGRIVKEPAQGRVLLATMVGILVIGVFCAYGAESGGNPILHALGVNQAQGNLEGKEVRFGTALTALLNVGATGTSTGAIAGATDSFMPLGGLVPLFLMQLGEVTPGGIGSGFYFIIVFALLSVFVAGLMVGRTPEYLGKKVQAREIKLAMLALLILTLWILCGAGLALVLPAGLAALANAGPHGLTEMLYAWTSATQNNGSAMAGITATGPLMAYGQGFAMLFGRFAVLIPVLAIAGSLAAKPKLKMSAGTFPTTGLLFCGLLAGVIVILGGLQFLPADALGPIAEHFVLLSGTTY